MGTQAISTLEQIVEAVERKVAPPLSETLDQFASALASIFRLKSDEVGILEILPPGRSMRFILPEKLRTTGTLPLNSGSAMASRTVRLRRIEIENNFSTVPHARVFEGVRMGRGHDEAIQKILSAPVVSENRVIGVVQLSRKGISPDDAGPDFSQADAATLSEFNDLIARFLISVREL